MSISQLNFPSDIYKDALIAARDYSTDALLGIGDGLSFIVADRDPDFPGEVGRNSASERLRAIRDELARRERLSRINRGLASPSDRKYEGWRTLTQMVRERTDMLYLFDQCGYHFVYRKGAKEAHAPCPICAGTDRLVITAGPPDLCWCRQCNWGGDVITVAMSFRQMQFRDAVSWLAELAGMPAERAA